MAALGFGTSAIPPSAGSGPASISPNSGAEPIPAQESTKQEHSNDTHFNHPIRMARL
jgi:hypothetical protein